MLSSLLYFILYSLPPLAGWWIAFRAPLGQRKMRAMIEIPASRAEVMAQLDPRLSDLRWNPHFEITNIDVIADAPLRVALSLRPRHGNGPLKRFIEAYDIDAGAGRVEFALQSIDDEVVTAKNAQRTAIILGETAQGTCVHIEAELRITGWMNYELGRLSITHYLAALQDAVLGRDARATPLLRFAGWRLLWVGLFGALALIALIIGPAFYMAIRATPQEYLPVGEGMQGAVVLILFGLLLFLFLLYLALLLVAATLAHEFGHALAMIAFGHRGVIVSLVPFGGGGVALSSRSYQTAFESGVVALAGPLLGGLAAWLLLPSPEIASVAYKSTFDPGSALIMDVWSKAFVFTGVIYGFLSVLLNVPNILPFTGSDGWRALRSIFSEKRLQLIGGAALMTLLAAVFAGRDDILPFTLMVLVISWYGRKRRDDAPPGAPRPAERVALAAGLLLTVGVYAHQASLLRRIDWRSAEAAQASAELSSPLPARVGVTGPGILKAARSADGR